MKNTIGGMVLFSALTGALAMSAFAAASAQTPQSGQSTEPAQTGQAAQTDPAAPSAPTAQTTPTADQIVARHLAAIGGKEAISHVKSISMETAVQVMGNEAPSTTIIVDGVGSRTDTDINGSKIVQCFTDKGGWSVNPMAGVTNPAPMPEDQYKLGKDGIYVGGELYNYADRGSKVELLGKDAATYKLKLTSSENVETVYVFDASTFMIKSTTRKGSMQGQDVDVTTNFSDYRKTDAGYMIPYTMDVDFGNFSLSIAVKKVEFNKTIDPAIFAMPKAETPAVGKTS